jgi:hypothetical protein
MLSKREESGNIKKSLALKKAGAKLFIDRQHRD